MLQEFLNNSLLPVKDEDNFDKLKKSSTELVKRLKKKESKIPSFTLTALDPEISPDIPNVEEVRKIITGKWKTFQNNSKDKPITFIRAVIFEALESISKDIELAAIIWLTGRNTLKHFKLVDKEKELISNFLLGLGNKIEKKAAQSWGLNSNKDASASSLEIKGLSEVQVNRSILQKRLEDASGPQNAEGEANYSSPNPHWPNANANWSYEFAPRAAKGIALSVDKALKEFTEHQQKINEAIKNQFTQFQINILNTNKLQQVRSQLLWWKESCYSPSFDQSYREMDSGLLEVLFAYDYSVFIPAIYPTSVDYFLKETYRKLSKENKKVKVSEILKQIVSFKAQLKTIIKEPKEKVGRISLLSFIQGLVWDKYSLKQFKKSVGFPSNTEMTVFEFILWVFHDLQVQKIISTK